GQAPGGWFVAGGCHAADERAEKPPRLEPAPAAGGGGRISDAGWFCGDTVRPNPRGGRFLRVGRLALRGGRHGSPPGGQGAHLEGNTEARGGRTKIASRK